MAQKKLGSTVDSTEKKDSQKNEELVIEAPPADDSNVAKEAVDPIYEIAAKLNEMFSNKTVEGMSFLEKQDVYGSTPTSADKLKRSENMRAISRVDRIKEEYKELSLAANPAKNIIKWLKVTGVETDETYGLCMITRLTSADTYTDNQRGEFKIKIPVSEFMVIDPKDPSYADKKKGYMYLQRELDKWVNTNIQAMIYNVNQKERTAMASRLAASAKLADYWFKPHGKEKARFKKGDIITGTVMSTKRDSITVSVYGQDFRIKTKEATWTAALPLHLEFKIGQFVDVKILDIQLDQIREVNGHSYNLAKITGSIRAAQENPNIAYYDDFEIDGKYVGKVKSTTADGTKVFVVLQNKVLCLCEAPLIGQLGEEVYVMVIRKEMGSLKNTIINDEGKEEEIEEETGLFWGTILRSNI